MKKLDDYMTEIVVIVANLLVDIITFLVVPEEAYIVVAIGILVSISIITLKRDIIIHYYNSNEIYQILDKIRNDELREKALLYLDECKQKLDSLAKGIHEEKGLEVFKSAIDRMKKVDIVLATHRAIPIELLYNWTDDPLTVNYYKANVEAKLKGTEIHRIFILKKDDILDSNNKIKNQKAIEVMKKQYNDKINLTIVWEQDIPDVQKQEYLSRNFAIFGDSIVQEQEIGKSEIDNKGWTIIDSGKVIIYKKKFDTLKNLGTPIDDFFKMYNII